MVTLLGSLAENISCLLFVWLYLPRLFVAEPVRASGKSGWRHVCCLLFSGVKSF